MATNLKILKMISGDEVMCEVVEDSSTNVTIKNPVRVVVIPSKTNPQAPTVGFAPWAEFSDEKQFTIHKAHVITMMKPVQEFINQYNGMFSGLIVPEKKIII